MRLAPPWWYNSGLLSGAGTCSITRSPQGLAPSRRPSERGSDMTTSGRRPAGWVQDHLTRYLQSNGEDGHLWNGVPTLLLTTTGRRSGKPHTTPLIYGRDGDRYLVVASRGGAPHHPAWYLNLAERPEVEVQVLADRFRANARTAAPNEKPALWAIMAGIFPPYNEYQSRTTRAIPLVILEQAGRGSGPAKASRSSR